MLRDRNERYGTIKFVDISSDGYSPEDNKGLDYKTVCVDFVSSCSPVRPSELQEFAFPVLLLLTFL